MKLAEALQERADLNRKIAQLKDRLRDNALHQEENLQRKIQRNFYLKSIQVY